MRGTLFHKIASEHLVGGKLVPGETARLKVDQVLTQDATGTMAYLEFEAIGVPRISTPLAVSYVDHNMLQVDFRNPDDHVFLQTTAMRYGARFSRPGNGICHQVHLERFAAPGKVLLGSDSHTPTAGGMCSVAIGVGGMDVATVMGGEPFTLTVPKVVRVTLRGKLNRPWVTAFDVILAVLRTLTVKGGVGKVVEYGGEGVGDLSLTERATVTNMGAELGATTSLFPSDERTRSYLVAQGRGGDYVPLAPDPDAEYAEEHEIDLSSLVPLVAQPFSPDKVVPLSELAGLPVDQVCIGSCTNSSYPALSAVASVLKGRTVKVSTTVTPGSKQVLEMCARDGFLVDIIGSGARVLESGCGPCIGMGQAPPSGATSLRSFNRNFRGRSGTADAQVYLANPIACAEIAVHGEFVDVTESGTRVVVAPQPERFIVNDNLVTEPPADGSTVTVVKGPNVKPVPVKGALGDRLEAPVLLVLGDNVSTDDIMPAGTKVLPLRSNIPAISEFVFAPVDETFAERAKEAGACIVVGGANYGQGSSREHAAIAPGYLGLAAVVAKSFARIHRSNLINWGIVPLLFENGEDVAKVHVGDTLVLDGVRAALESGKLSAKNATTGETIPLSLPLAPAEREVLAAGGRLSYIAAKRGGG